MRPTPARSAANRSLRELVSLALPLVTVQVGLMAMGVVDTIMVGRISPTALAAVALGNLYFYVLAIFGMGTLMVLDPVVAQAVGAGDKPAVSRAMQRGLLIAAVLSLVIGPLLATAGWTLTVFGQPTDVVPIAADFAISCIPGTFPFFVFVALRQTLQALGKLRAIVITVIGGNVANICLNYLLIYGKFGAPELGAVGSGWASSISRILMVVALVWMAWPTLRPVLLPFHRDVVRVRPLLRMLGLGAPIGGQHVLEYAAFAFVALLMGWLGTNQVAAHQVAINLASLTFMVPLGIGSAAAVLVGRAAGRNDAAGAQRSAVAALACGTGFMCITAVVFLAAPELLASIYTHDVGVLRTAILLIPVAGVFQVFDGLQIVATGVLRGLGDTRTPFIVSMVAYWFIGIPISFFLGFRTNAGPAGLWWGFVAGLATVAVCLLLRARWLFARSMSRVRIDDMTDSRAVNAEM
ncbi:MAG: MATE family efflux transporter [Anaerolineae bacterium]|nr:MATE family efflux transporter [Gemmatimonadaceae bacterium]